MKLKKFKEKMSMNEEDNSLTYLNRTGLSRGLVVPIEL
jgi:hypothetical protein